LNENGFTHDFNLHEEDIVKTPINMRSNIFTAMKGNTDPEMRQSSMEYNSSGKKGSL
jgi:hypothetical protein